MNLGVTMGLGECLPTFITDTIFLDRGQHASMVANKFALRNAVVVSPPWRELVPYETFWILIS